MAHSTLQVLTTEDQERAPNAQHEFEDETETISLLSGTPLTPGRAEGGGLSSPQMRSGSVKVCLHSFGQLESIHFFQKRSSIRILGYTLVGLVALASLIGIVASFLYSETSNLSVGRRRLTMDHIFNGTFYPSQPDLNWVAEGMLNAHYNHHMRLIRALLQLETAYTRN
jgi:hypothetical protein